MTMLGVSFYSAFFELGTFVDPATSALAKPCSAAANGENDLGRAKIQSTSADRALLVAEFHPIAGNNPSRNCNRPYFEVTNITPQLNMLCRKVAQWANSETSVIIKKEPLSHLWKLCYSNTFSTPPCCARSMKPSIQSSPSTCSVSYTHLTLPTIRLV